MRIRRPDPLRDLNYIAAILLLANTLIPSAQLPAFMRTMNTVEQYGFAVLLYIVIVGTHHYWTCVTIELLRIFRGLRS